MGFVYSEELDATIEELYKFKDNLTTHFESDDAGINPGGNPDPEAPMPDYMRGKTNDGEDY